MKRRIRSVSSNSALFRCAKVPSWKQIKLLSTLIKLETSTTGFLCLVQELFGCLETMDLLKF